MVTRHLQLPTLDIYSALDKNTNFTSFKFTESNGVPSNFGFVSSMFTRPTLGGVGSLTTI